MKNLTNENANIIIKASQKITYKALKTIAAKGNAAAHTILNTYKHDIIDDLQQEVAAKVLENIDFISFNENDAITAHQKSDYSFLTLTFLDYEYNEKTEKYISPSKRSIYGVVQNTLYAMQQKNYSHTWINNTNGINTKGEPVAENEMLDSVMYTQAVRQYQLSIEDIEIKELIKELHTILTDKQSTVLDFLIDGYNHSEIAVRLNVSPQAIDKIVKNIRKALKSLNDTIIHDVPQTKTPTQPQERPTNPVVFDYIMNFINNPAESTTDFKCHSCDNCDIDCKYINGKYKPCAYAKTK